MKLLGPSRTFDVVSDRPLVIEITERAIGLPGCGLQVAVIGLLWLGTSLFSWWNAGLVFAWADTWALLGAGMVVLLGAIIFRSGAPSSVLETISVDSTTLTIARRGKKPIHIPREEVREVHPIWNPLTHSAARVIHARGETEFGNLIGSLSRDEPDTDHFIALLQRALAPEASGGGTTSPPA